ncbi:hypothetical protein BWQ96_07944 [Gracilariopsis chorda]|uniref:Uncharacterized protein n=1 Tax=Gracilariopsis chorda TaxID=448386 RepID=A0A2V3IJS6_9FLOR|nr:hypothetical protein BWQ96_07944 [Gracilariopsis chorda]|eukprot:PXF42309.1 hypothetical protein BWQ96_07944 [Gracilariopsis chorda]
MTQTPESGNAAKRRRRAEPSPPPSWRAADHSLPVHHPLFAPPIDVSVPDPAPTPAAVVVPNAPAIVPPLPAQPPQNPPTQPILPAPFLAPEAKEKLRAVLKALEIDPRALTRLVNINTMPTEKPTIKPAYALLRKIIATLAPIAYPADPTALAQMFDARAQANASVQQKLISNIITAMKATKRGTIARRYVRSVLCGSMSRAEVNRLLGHDDDAPAHEDDSDDGKEDTLKMTGKTFSRARRDWEVLTECGELQPAKYGRTKVQDESLRHLLAFLFSQDNLVLISWTALRIVIDDKRINLPAVMVSRNGSLMHQEYCKTLEATASNPLSRGSFYAVLNALTRKELKWPLPIDNPTRTLVKDPLILLRDIAIRVVPYEERGSFLREIDKAEWFLMHSFVESHLGTDASGFHDISFALTGSAMLEDPRAMEHRTIECRGCIFPFTVVAHLVKMAAHHDSDEVKTVSEACRNKFVAYMRYLCRKTAQDLAIENAVHELRTKKVPNRLIVFMNYINALDPSAKSGKIPILQGASLHGATVFFCHERNNFDTKETLKHVSYHHFISPSGYEDSSVSAFVTEALLHHIRLDFPEADELLFVTDNLPLYKNDFFPAFLPHVSRRHGFRAIRLIHSCSQICEFLLDAQFEQVMKVLLSHFSNGNTPTIDQALSIINSDNRLIGTAAGHILLERECQEFTSSVKLLRSHGSAIPELGDANDIAYQDWQVSEVDKAEETHSVKARVHDFGGINETYVDIHDGFFRSLPNRRQARISDILRSPAETPSSVSLNASRQSSAAGIGAPGFTIFTQHGEERPKPANIPEDGVSTCLQIPNPISITQAYSTGGEVHQSSNQFETEDWIGPVTRVRLIGARHRVSVAEMKVSPFPHGVTGGLVIDTINRIHAHGNRLLVSVEKPVKEEPSITPLSKTGIAGRSCQGCHRSFKSERFLQSHQCKGPPVDKDVSARAVVLATEMYRDGELPAFADPLAFLWSGTSLGESGEVQTISGLECGWARNPTPEAILESNTTLVYKTDVFQWLDEGRAEAELPASVFRDRLLGKYPQRDDVPSLAVIEGWCVLRKALWRIQPFCQVGRDGTPVIVYGEEAENGGGKSRMKSRYIAKITEMHMQQLGMDEAARPKPRYMFKEFEDFFRDGQGRLPPDFPNQKQVINKINALRSKSKHRVEAR